MNISYQRLITRCLLISLFIFLCGVTACVRFTDNGDGTVTDERTGLIWLQNANCYGPQSWDIAMSIAAGLNSGECGLSDDSTEGKWHLATKEELQGIGTDPPTTWQFGPPPGDRWTEPGSPFVSVQSWYYWSSTEYNTSNAWHVSMGWGGAFNTSKVTMDDIYVWPVRSDN